MDYDYHNCIISDYSNLGHFVDNSDGQGETALGRMLDRIAEHCLIDVRHLETDNIVTLLEYMASQGVTE